MNGYDKWSRRQGERAGCGSSRRSPSGGVVFGILIIVAGTAMLLDNLGIIRARDFWDYLPLALAALGVGKIVESQNRPIAVLFGGLMAVGGTVWFLDNIGVLQISGRFVIPMAIIGFGVVSLLRTVERQRHPETGGGTAVPQSQVQMFTMFGGAKRVVDALDFRGGDLFAIFGGIDLDLRQARLAQGASVDANALFGGVEIHVPLTWSVEVRGTGVFGGYEDKTIHPAPDPQFPAPKLIITGTAIFGGVSVSNA